MVCQVCGEKRRKCATDGCYYCPDDEEVCYGCQTCIKCVENICYQCELCIDCTLADYCFDCSACSDCNSVCKKCNKCKDCETHCKICNKCCNKVLCFSCKRVMDLTNLPDAMIREIVLFL